MSQQSYRSQSPEDLLPIAKNILEACNPVRIFALFGEMGAGKTTLIQRFCEALGVLEAVQSPTFTLVHSYQAEQGMVYHFDCYRMRSEMEAFDIGLEEYLDSGDYVFIEWPEKIPSLLPPETVRISIHLEANQDRTIQLMN